MELGPGLGPGPGASHSPGRHLEFVDPGQDLGCALQQVALAGARQGLVPVRPVDVGLGALQHLPHRHHQARPAEAVVGRSQGLSLRRTGDTGRVNTELVSESSRGAQTYLLDHLQGQGRGLGENLDVDAVSRVVQDQAAHIKPPTDTEEHVTPAVPQVPERGGQLGSEDEDALVGQKVILIN